MGGGVGKSVGVSGREGKSEGVSGRERKSYFLPSLSFIIML